MADPTATRFWTWAALAVSGAAVAGSLSLSLFVGHVACPLCFYQRAFAMAVFGVLAMSLLSRASQRVPPAVLAMPVALAGLFVGAWHSYLVASGALECPSGLFGLGPAPYQSLVVFLLIVLTLAWDTGAFIGDREARPDPGQTPPPPGRILLVALGPLVLGLLLAGGCILASLHGDKQPYDPAKLYESKEPLICRKPRPTS